MSVVSQSQNGDILKTAQKGYRQTKVKRLALLRLQTICKLLVLSIIAAAVIYPFSDSGATEMDASNEVPCLLFLLSSLSSAVFAMWLLIWPFRYKSLKKSLENSHRRHFKRLCKRYRDVLALDKWDEIPRNYRE